MKLKKIEKVDADGWKEVYHVDEQGRKQGKYIKYRPDGSKSIECNYKNDKRHGKCVAYNTDGSKDVKCYYKYDKLHGKYISYNPDGSKDIKCNFKNGTKKECKVYQNNILLKKTLYNDKGQKVEERKYFYPEEDKE